MEYAIPPDEAGRNKNITMKDLLTILEKLPCFIDKNISQQEMSKLYQQYCDEVPNETERFLVMIDGGRYEFYAPDPTVTKNDCLPFDYMIMEPFLSSLQFSFLRRSYPDARFFRKGLHTYIFQCYELRDRLKFHIHSVSLLLDFPGSSDVRQWSHIDGEDTYYQGSLICGNGTSLTLEFPVLDPPISCVQDLQQVWDFFETDSLVFKAISECNVCTDLLQKYGNLLNHDAEHPTNSPTIHKWMVNQYAKQNPSKDTKNWHSIYPAGTLFRMPGNTIHAGPPSHKRKCRAIFFYAAAPPGCFSTYDPETQWNQVSLTVAILVNIWPFILPIERGMILEYIRRVQSNPKIAPSDTSLFVTNYTMRLFIRISILLPSPRSGSTEFKKRYIQFIFQLSHIPNISAPKQFITQAMIKKLDRNLPTLIFKHEGRKAAKSFFLL
jgi:hypothetical protein